ncbi:hypothetical protein NL533_32615, partial [Klebsiella pneumoniae]|nr:hypothetical protein [Klebsiella pneumoniae]
KGRTLTLQMADGAKIRVGDKDSTLADLKEGDSVTVTYRMRAQAVRSVEGTNAYGLIKSISADKDQFVIKDERGKEFTFHVNKDAKVR